MKKILIVLVSFSCLNFAANAAGRMGRLGIGMSNHLPTNMQTLSVKLQRNRSTAIGGLFGLDSSSEGSNYALGAKIFKNIYEEPQLNFYSSGSLNIFTYEDTEEDKTKQGYLMDATFGAEFSFQGLESIGLSFEFGLGLSQYNGESHFQTVGYNVIQSAIHFYL